MIDVSFEKICNYFVFYMLFYEFKLSKNKKRSFDIFANVKKNKI